MRNSQQGDRTMLRFSYQQPATFNRLSVIEADRSRRQQEELFQPFKRVASLPPRKAESSGPPVQESHIKIVQSIAEAETQSKQRKRAKIFGDSPQPRPMSVPKPVQLIQQTPPKVVNQSRVATPSSPLMIQQPLPDPDIQQRVYTRILDKLSQTQLSPLRQTNVSLTKKEQQIHLLKLQIQRMKRCQQLSQENQSLYQRLVEKLKQIDISRDSIRGRSPKRMSVVQRASPKKSLSPKRNSPLRRDMSEIITLHQVEDFSSSVKGEESILINRRPQERQPCASPLDQHRATFMSLQNSGIRSDTLTFSRPTKGPHPKRIKAEVFSIRDNNKYKLYDKMQHKQELYEMPLTQRLEEINGQLQRSMVRKGRQRQERPQSKPKAKYSSSMNWTTSSPVLMHQTQKHVNYGRYYPRMAY